MVRNWFTLMPPKHPPGPRYLDTVRAAAGRGVQDALFFDIERFIDPHSWLIDTVDECSKKVENHAHAMALQHLAHIQELPR